MPVARHPPHRSVREELPHTASASGRGAKPQRRIHASLELGIHFSQLPLPPLPHRFAHNRELPLPRLPATVREPEKVDRFRHPFAPCLAILGGEPPKLDQLGLTATGFEPESVALCRLRSTRSRERLRRATLLQVAEGIGKAHSGKRA